MWTLLPEVQKAIVQTLERSKRLQTAMEVFLYAMAFCGVMFGLAALGNLI